jgi:hypothetical protein
MITTTTTTTITTTTEMKTTHKIKRKWQGRFADNFLKREQMSE